VFNHFSQRLKLALLSLIGVVIFSSLGFSWSLYFSSQSLTALRDRNLLKSAISAQRALPVVTVATRLTMGLQPDLVVWHDSLSLLAQSTTYINQLREVLEIAPDEVSPAQVKDFTSLAFEALDNINRQLPKTWLLQHFVSQERLTQLQEVVSLGKIVQQEVLTGPQTWVVLFQNPQELRPTGGFMGSLAFVTLDNGSITKIEIQDIYQPAGQLTTYLEPPAGVKEYLSGGKGWQLPDANWSPDFPVSAQTILKMLAESGYQNLNGVVAVNLDVAKSLMRVTGPISLPDYEIQVTPENVAQVLRTNRGDFFPGSVSKQHLLSSYFTQLKQQLLELEPAQQAQLWPLLLGEVTRKNVQFYALSPELETLFINSRAASLLSFPQDLNTFYLTLSEANVGINKANQNISRTVTLKIQPTTTQATITFSNQNQLSDRPNLSPETAGARHLHYINYQRLYVLPTTQLISLTYRDRKIENWQETLIWTAAGQELKEISFLLTVLESQTSRLELEMTHLPLAAKTQVVLQKQSGITHIPYQLVWQGQTHFLNLDQDLLFTLP